MVSSHAACGSTPLSRRKVKWGKRGRHRRYVRCFLEFNAGVSWVVRRRLAAFVCSAPIDLFLGVDLKLRAAVADARPIRVVDVKGVLMDRQGKSLLPCGWRARVLVPLGSSATTRALGLAGLAVAVVALLTLAPAAGGVPTSTAPTLSGDAAGLRLVRQVNRSYAAVSAVRLEVAAGGFIGRFTLVMRNGVVVAEQALVDEGGSEATLLVRREHQGTFVHNPNRDCWRSVPASDPQALTDVGKPLLSGPGRVSRPRIAATTITLTITREGHAARAVIDKRTMHLRRFEAVGYLARFTNLSKRPALPTPVPHC
jgi:hypothetical protein